MQRIAMSWLVYRLTGSAWLLGLVGFMSQIPSLLLVPVVGVIVDSQDRLRIIIITQTLAMIQAFILAALILTNTVQVWHIILLSLFLGLINAFDQPARQTFVQDMVEKKEDLSNAIGMNSLLFNGARLIGPSLAGILIAIVGEGWCFFLNGVSYIAVIIALFMMRIKKQEVRSIHGNFINNFLEGARYSFGFEPIRFILLNIFIIGLMGLPFLTLMPIFARDILHGGPATMGFLMASVGIGAIIGAIMFAMRRTLRGIGRSIAYSTAVFSVGLILFSHMNLMWLSMIFLAVIGLGQITSFTSSNTSLQTMADDDKRGRVLAFYNASFMGAAPFGSLISGGLANSIGAPNTVLIGGIISLLGAALFYWKLPNLTKQVRPIFIKMGVEYPNDLNITGV